VAHADDDSDPYMSGIVGVFARLQNQGDQMNVEFDNAEMSIPTGFGNITCP